MKRIILFIVVFGMIVSNIDAQGIVQMNRESYSNPILPGFNPDPSIIRVEEDYYMVTSSFEFWPGLPVYHSKDLVNWELINYVVNSDQQMNMKGIDTSNGFFAPTLRYHDGTFFVAVSYVTLGPFHVKNMIFTTDDIKGTWSKPHLITDGTEWKIDPDLFFDEDGRVYFSANAQQPEYPDLGWRTEIRIQELDINRWELTGKRHTISDGAMQDAVSVEGPHIYKKDGYYYLIVAEGGTGMGHAVTVFRSKEIFGPYVSYDLNPLLTHRHMANTAYIQRTGHADIVQTQTGEWWMVLLGIRDVDGVGAPLGRETFLVPMKWDDNQFPVVSPGTGKVLLEHKRPALPLQPFSPVPAIDDFAGSELPLYWNIIRNTQIPYYLKDGQLVLPLQPYTLKDTETPAFVGRRLQHHSFDITAKMKFDPAGPNEEAGVSLMLNKNRFYHLIVSRENNREVIQVKKGGEGEVLFSVPLDASGEDQWVYLRITSDNHSYDFAYSLDGSNYTPVAEKLSGKHLNTSAKGGGWIFTGTYTGMYATSNGKSTENNAVFEWFSYQGLE